MRIDFTLTLPGLFEVERIERLSATYGTQILAKVIFSFSPDIVMSPLALPRSILEPWIDETLSSIANGNSPLKDILVQLKTRPTFQEQYGKEEYAKGIARGKARVLQLEKIRGDTFTMGHILSERTDVYEWWNSIS
jgi:hypothetical protein